MTQGEELKEQETEGRSEEGETRNPRDTSPSERGSEQADGDQRASFHPTFGWFLHQNDRETVRRFRSVGLQHKTRRSRETSGRAFRIPGESNAKQTS